MSWFVQAKVFFSEVKATIEAEKHEEKKLIHKDDLEFVSSSSEARLLSVSDGASFLIFLSVVTVAGLILWSTVMQVDEVANTEGQVIPSKQIQVIQNLEGGIVKEINVVEGESVDIGTVLLVIDDVYAKSDVDENTDLYNDLLARMVALNTLISGKNMLNFPRELHEEIEVMHRTRERFNAEWHASVATVLEIESAIEQRQKELDAAISDKESRGINYKLAKQQLEMNLPLLKSGAISEVQLLKIKQEVNQAESEYNSSQHAVPKAKSAFHETSQKRESFIRDRNVAYEKELNEVKNKLNSMQAKGVSLQAKLSHSKVTSPVVGTVKKIDFNTIGGVIRPGIDIMEIVPTDDKLLIEVKINPKDIGFITVGQHAIVKITAFDFSVYGGLEGSLVYLSADTITDNKGNSYYLGRIRTDTNIIQGKKGKNHTIIPGMKTRVDIVLDKKSILAYILKPMLK